MFQKTSIALPMLWIFDSANRSGFLHAAAYAGLLAYADENGVVMESNERIAAATPLALSAFKYALCFLRDNGYITVIRHLSRENPYLYNRYILKPIEGEHVHVPMEALTAGLRPCSFVIYCYILWQHQKYNAVPSTKQICADVGVYIDSVHNTRQQLKNTTLPMEFKPE